MELNKIYLGDCYKLIKEVPDKSIDLCYLDVPYDFEGNGGGVCFGEKKRDYHNEYENVAINTQVSGVHRRMAKSASECGNIAFGFDYSLLDELVRVMKHIYIYIWCSKKQILPLMKYFIEEKGCNFDLLVWHKTDPIPTVNNKYLSDLEYCLMFRDKDTRLYGSYATKSKCFTSTCNKEDKNDYGHPTIKNLQMVKNHIINSTQPGDVVLDCFSGSGTTCVAAKELDRKYIGFEIDPTFHKISVDRLNGINKSGQTDLLATDFDKLQEEWDLAKAK